MNNYHDSEKSIASPRRSGLDKKINKKIRNMKMRKTDEGRSSLGKINIKAEGNQKMKDTFKITKKERGGV